MSWGGCSIDWRDWNRLSHPKRSSKHFRPPDGSIPEDAPCLTESSFRWCSPWESSPSCPFDRSSSTLVDFASANQRRIAPVSVWRGNGLGSHRCAICSSRRSDCWRNPRHQGRSIGLRLMGIDGTVYDVPDAEANAAAFSRPSAGPRGEGDPASPQAQLGRVGDPQRSRLGHQARPLWRANDGRRVASSSGIEDAAAFGPGF